MGQIKHPVLWHYTCNQHKYEIPLMIQEWDTKVWILRENNHMCILSLTTSTVINDISSESILTSLGDVGKNPPLHSPSNISNMQLSYIKIEPQCKSPPKLFSKLLQKLSLNILTLVSRSQSAVYDPPRPFVNMCYLRPKCKTRLFDGWKLWKLAALANFNRCSIWHHKIEFSKCGRVSTEHVCAGTYMGEVLPSYFNWSPERYLNVRLCNHKCVQKKAGIFGLMRQCQKEPLNWNPCQHDANDTHLVAFNNV